jgi:hypothetical protein
VKLRYYRGAETDRYVVPHVASAGAAPWERDQASQIRDALLLARCQPHVGAFFNFEPLDEDRLAGWQSGVLWRDGSHKASYDTFRDAVRLVESGGSRLLERPRRRWTVAARSSERATSARRVTCGFATRRIRRFRDGVRTHMPRVPSRGCARRPLLLELR